jgi:hypothetical protein
MTVTQFVFLFSMLGASAPAPTVDSPGAPSNLKRAEGQRLHRLNAAELKQFVPLVLERKTRGAIEQTAYNDSRGPQRIDEANNTYCDIFTRKRSGEESCFAVFRAANGAHYFGYDINRGGHPHVWHRSPMK